MSTPPETGGQGFGGGWEPSGWKSEWQQPQGDRPWQQQSPSPWQQTPDGRWMQPGAGIVNGKATASLVLGILGLVLFPLVCSILALVLGYQSRREIDDSGGRMTGRSNAVAGIVLGWIGVALVVLGVIAIILAVALAGGDSSTVTGTPA